jgi:hypothetical protein
MLNGNSTRSRWTKTILAAAATALLLIAAGRAHAETWSFGVMADTQWTTANDGKNPNSVAVDIINQINQEFINKNVKFVVQVGDLTDKGTNAALGTRAAHAQALYSNGIGFFPLRGNHESSAAAATEFKTVLPQTGGGPNNATPAYALQANGIVFSGSPLAIGGNFSSPSTDEHGLSYSFDYNNARLVLLDQFTPSSRAGNDIASQQSWISATLSSRSPASHVFVFGHKGLITENHPDTLFGSDPSKKPAAQDAFITSLHDNGVRYLISGHDHMHNRSLMSTTDGASAFVQQIVWACPDFRG